MEMKNVINASFLAIVIMSAPIITAQEISGSFLKSEYMPEIHGTIRAKYEYEPPIDKGRLRFAMHASAWREKSFRL